MVIYRKSQEICQLSEKYHRILKLPPVFKPPEEMPCPKDWLTQSLSRIISHEAHISPNLQALISHHYSPHSINQ